MKGLARELCDLKVNQVEITSKKCNVLVLDSEEPVIGESKSRRALYYSRIRDILRFEGINPNAAL